MLQDFRHAIRLLLKSPGFSAVAVVVLALGIGANTAVFSLVNGLMLQPLPTDEAGVVGIYSRSRKNPDSYRAFSWADYEHLRAARGPFEELMAYTVTLAGVAEGNSTRRSFIAIVSASYFSTLGVRLTAGRPFTAAEARPDSDERVVIVGHEYARNAGLTTAEALGRLVRLNARDYTIVGVAAEGFSGTMSLVAPEFWVPTGVYASVTEAMFRDDGASARLGDPKNHALILVGRLRPGIDPDGAQPMLDSLSQSLERNDPAENGDHEIIVNRLARMSISTRPQDDTEFAVLSGLLMGTAALVLLISCLNLANMMLARGTARRKEIAVRLALGSSRARVLRQLLTESLILSAIGTAVGLLFAYVGTRLLVDSLAAALPFVITLDARPDVRVLGAMIGFCVVSTIIAGFVPAWRITRPNVLPDLKEQPVDYGGRRRFTLRNGLVVGQIALSLALLTAAGLFMRGAINASVADPGFPLEGGIIANIDPTMAGYDDARGRAATRNILERIRRTPGVQSASPATIVPFGEFQEVKFVQKAGTPPAPAGQREEGVEATFTIIGTDYFEALRLPVLRGRGFTPSEEDASGGAPVAIVDEPLVRRLFGGDDPMGQRIQFAQNRNAEKTLYTIVGVVAGVRNDLFERGPGPHVYVPVGQNFRGHMNLHVRLSSSDERAEAAMLGTIRQQIRAADEAVPVLQVRTLRQHRDNSIMLWAVNTGARMFSTFGAIALLLAVSGVYGVRSYVVSRRTREIGIRIALGATPSDVLRLVLREGLALTMTGLGVGLLLAWAVSKALSGLLYEVSALDPIVFAAASLVLAVAAMTASYLPARRATRVLPLTALRSE